MARRLLLLSVPALSACGTYRPGTDGTRPALIQNGPANRDPQPPGSMNL